MIYTHTHTHTHTRTHARTHARIHTNDRTLLTLTCMDNSVACIIDKTCCYLSLNHKIDASSL